MTTPDPEKAKAFVLSRYPNVQCGLAIVGANKALRRHKQCSITFLFLPSPHNPLVVGHGSDADAAWIAAAEYIVENG